MYLILMWSIFIIVTCKFSFYNSNYFLVCCCMFFLIYFCNLIQPTKISLKTATIIVVLPSVLFWYVISVYNNFLCINPIKYEILILIICFYSYILLYIICECEF